MAAQQNSKSASDFELTLLVLNFLEEKGWDKTASSLRKEAKDILASGTPTSVKSLPAIVNEYLNLLSRDIQRSRLQQYNPLAQAMYSLLDYNAGMSPTYQHAGVGMHPASHLLHPPQPSGLATGVPPLTYGTDGGGPASMVPMDQVGGPRRQQQQQQPLETQFASPGRHAARKGAPKKRRRLDLDFDGNRSQLPNSPPDIHSNDTSMFGDINFDLLYKEVDPAAVMQLLDDPEVNKFSTLLAENINRHGPHPGEDIDFSLSEILKDPEAADFLQKIVAHEDHPPLDHHHNHNSNGAGPSSAAAAAAPAGPPGGRRTRSQALHDVSGDERTQLPEKHPLELSRQQRPQSPSDTRTKRKQQGGSRSGSAAGMAAKGKQNVPDEIAEYLDKPDELEDLINECIG